MKKISIFIQRIKIRLKLKLVQFGKHMIVYLDNHVRLKLFILKILNRYPSIKLTLKRLAFSLLITQKKWGAAELRDFSEEDMTLVDLLNQKRRM